MKKEERLGRLFGEIDDDLVAGAANRPIPIKVWLPRVTAAVAAVALTAGLAVAQPWASDKPPVEDGETTITTVQQNAPADGEIGQDPTGIAPTQPTSSTPTTAAEWTPDIWYEQPWEEKPMWRRYPDFERFEIGNYIVYETTVDAGKVGEYLQDVKLHGYDNCTQTPYDEIGKIYRIEGFNDTAAVALQYPGRTDYFPAVNGSYTPETLGAFITDVNLRENMTVGTVYGKYLDEQNFTHTAEYVGLTVEAVWELLLQKTDAANEYDYEKVIELDGSMDIAVSVPLLGIHNLSLRVTVDGYLFTNLMDTGKIFYIGEDATAAFMDYVRNHCRINYDSGPMSGETTTVYAGTTTTSSAQPPLATGTTVWKEPPM